MYELLILALFIYKIKFIEFLIALPGIKSKLIALFLTTFFIVYCTSTALISITLSFF